MSYNISYTVHSSHTIIRILCIPKYDTQTEVKDIVATESATPVKKTKKKKPRPWIRPRHKVVRNILYYTLGTYCRLRYNAKVETFKEWEDRPYLILLNH